MTPLVVVWGPGVEGWTATSHDGVDIVVGSAFADWRRRVSATEPLDPTSVSSAHEALKTYQLRRERYEAERRSKDRFVEAGVPGLAFDLGAGVVGGFLGFYSTVSAFGYLRPLAFGVVAMIPVAAIGVPIRATTWGRTLGTGWLTGSACAIVLALVATAVYLAL